MKLYEIAWNKVKSCFNSIKKVDLNKDIYNPLNLKINSAVIIDTYPFELMLFQVSSINSMTVHFDSEPDKQMTDYILSDMSKLNTLDSEHKIKALDNRYCFLSLIEEHEYSEELLEVFNSDFISRVENDLEVDYEKCHRRPYQISIKNIRDRNGDGKITRSELINKDQQMWQFRLQDTDKYIFVELDKSNGWIEVWEGFELPKNFILST